MGTGSSKQCVCVLTCVGVYSRNQAAHLFVILLFVLGGGSKHSHATAEVWRSENSCPFYIVEDALLLFLLLMCTPD